MSFSFVYSRAIIGIKGYLVKVEAHISSGLPQFHIVGLPEKSLRESKERVRSAIINAQFRFPMGRITVNLAPGDLPKQGSHFDLAIAVSILLASNQLKQFDASQYEFSGELTLSGELRAIRLILPFALATQKAKRTLYFPRDNQPTVSLIDDLSILPANNLLVSRI